MKKVLLILVVFLGFAGCTSANEGSTSLLAASVVVVSTPLSVTPVVSSVPVAVPVVPLVTPVQLPSNTYRVSVICDLPTAIAAGKYDWVDPDITPANFPEVNCRPGQTEVTLVHFGHAVTGEKALIELDKRGLRPATLPELLALDAVQRELPKKFSIVGLGSVLWNSDDSLVCPVLNGRDHRRRLYLDFVHSGWHDGYRFLATRK